MKMDTHSGISCFTWAPALHLDFQHHVVALVHPVLHGLAGRAVVVAHIFGVLQHFPLLDEALELLAAEEIVLLAVLLPRAGAPGGGGDRQPQVLILGEKLL